MIDYIYWILYSKDDENKVLAFKTKMGDCLIYRHLCVMHKLNPDDYLSWKKNIKKGI